jgi:hypothetical protein
MKKIYILFVLWIAQLSAAAQCNPCPNFFSVSDADFCIQTDLGFQGNTTTGIIFGNTDTTQLNFCENSISTLCITPLPTFNQGNTCDYPSFAIDSISITGGTLISNTTNCFTVHWSTISNAVVTIYFSIPGSNGLSCRGEIQLKVKLLDAPFATFTANPQPACFSNPTSINFNSSGTIGAGSYFWDFGDGFTGVGASPSHSYYAPGTYTVCLYASAAIPDTSILVPPVGGSTKICNACIDTFCNVITIDNLPPPDIDCINTVCAGQIDKYCTSASGCSAYNWSVIGGTILSGAGTNCITVQWGSGNPQGTINLNVTGCTTNYCTIGNSATVPIIPSAATMLGNTIVCQGELENYSIPILPATTYSWNIIGIGGTIVNNNTNTPTIGVQWSTPGTYTVECTYTNTALNCGGQSSKIVTVLPKLKITGITNICENNSTVFSSIDNVLNTAINSFWTISPATASVTTGQNSPYATIQFNTAGTFTISANGVSPTLTCQPETFVITVHPNPIITNIIGDTIICANSFKDYKVISSDPSGNFIWTITNGTYTPISGNSDSIQINWGPNPPYSVSVFQISGQNCTSNTFTENYVVGATPNIAGPTNVCADAVTTYTLSSPSVGNFTWYVTPAQYGTVLSGQGTNIASVQWSGINIPAGTNTVYLHYGFCGTDSIAITITDPSPITISQTGALCTTGITLSTASATSYNWSCVEHAISPIQSNTNPTLVNLNLPGTYNVTLINVNGTGCDASATRVLAPIGLPVATIISSGPFNYCFPALPNIVLNAATAAGYSYQWFLNSAPIGTGTTLNVNNTAPCNITGIGTYVFLLQVTQGGCTDVSDPIIVIVDSCLSGSGGGPSCVANLVIDSIKFCNPFDIYSTISAPGGGTPTGVQSIYHYEDNTTTIGNTTKTFTSGIGYKLVRVCQSILLPSTTICTACKDTSVLVTVFANFLKAGNCGRVNFANTSQVVAPNTITGYSWSVGTYPANSTVPPVIASYNNPFIANPILNINVADTFIVTLTVTASNICTSTKTDTVISHKADASFSFSAPCMGSATNFTSTVSGGAHYWNFGDASASYIDPTIHTYATSTSFVVTHTVTNSFGCRDTVLQPVSILPKPICVLTYTGSTAFCSNDSLVLTACGGNSNYQWYNNGVMIPSATTSTYTATTNGQYYLHAIDPNGCLVVSDTVAVTVFPSPIVNIIQQDSACAFSNVTFTTAACNNCFYQWQLDNNIVSTSIPTFDTLTGFGLMPVGVHTVSVTVANAFGCFATDSVIVTVHPQPTIAITVNGPLPICGNNIYTISATTSATSPIWNWQFSGFSISNNDTILANAAGTYQVTITDGTSGCTASAVTAIAPSPDLSLFPIGCDSLCDTSTLTLPLPSINFNIAGYSIDWYNNAPPYISIYTGSTIPLGLLAFNTNHQLSVIVTSPNGCTDTSNVYDFYLKKCSPTPLSIHSLIINGTAIQDVAQLYWLGNHQQNTNTYIVEKSKDGNHFMPIQTITANQLQADGTTYHLQNTMDNNGKTTWYRVAQYFTDGTVAKSNTIALQNNNVNTEKLIVAPNIITNETKIYFTSTKKQTVTIKVINTLGQVVKTITQPMQFGTNTTDVNVSQLANGTYQVILQTDVATYVQKIIKI